MVVICPKCGTAINRKEWDEVKNKWKEGNKITNVPPPTTIQIMQKNTLKNIEKKRIRGNKEKIP